MLVYSDQIGDASIHTGPGLAEITRVYTVTGLSGKTIMEQARFAAGVPQYGEGDKVYPYLIALDHHVAPIMGDNGKWVHTAAKVIVTFKGILPGQQGGGETFVSFGSTSQQTQTDQDRDGKMLQVFHDSRPGKPQRGVAPKHVKGKIIVFRKRIYIKGTGNLLTYPTPVETLQGKYDGKVNKSAFRGAAPHEWMATVSGDTDSLGRAYDLSITLERRAAPDSWDEWIYFKLPNGEIPANVDKPSANGAKLCKDNYAEAEFSEITNDLNNL